MVQDGSAVDLGRLATVAADILVSAMPTGHWPLVRQRLGEATGLVQLMDIERSNLMSLPPGGQEHLEQRHVWRQRFLDLLDEHPDVVAPLHAAVSSLAPPAQTWSPPIPASGGNVFRRHPAIAWSVTGAVAFLAVAAITIATVYLVVDSGPRTIVTLTASGGPPDAQALARAQEIIGHRLEATGFDDPDVRATSTGLVVTVDGRHPEEAFAPLLGPGQVRFRKVLNVVADQPGDRPPAPGTEGTSGLTAAEVAILPAEIQFKVPQVSCAALNARPIGSIVDAPQSVVACEVDGKEKMLLDTAKVVGADVGTATAAISNFGDWTVNLTFNSAGAAKWTSLTREAFNNEGDACVAVEAGGAGGGVCRVAIVRDTVIISAPAIQGVIGAEAEISGGLDRDSARLLAAQLAFGPLPVTLTIASVKAQ